MWKNGGSERLAQGLKVLARGGHMPAQTCSDVCKDGLAFGHGRKLLLDGRLERGVTHGDVTGGRAVVAHAVVGAALLAALTLREELWWWSSVWSDVA